MANPEHLAILKQGVEEWNRWREQHKVSLYFQGEDLSGCDLKGFNLQGIDFNQTDLRNSDLSRASLIGANLRKAKLQRTNLFVADLSWADLSRAVLTRAKARWTFLLWANLSFADLRHTDLRGANLHRATLAGAEFTSSTMLYTTLTGLDLALAKGLKSVLHLGPSSVGVDTLEKTIEGLEADDSNRADVEQFLRASGVSQRYFQFFVTQIGKPVKFFSLYISHSSKDEYFAQRLYTDLQDNGVRCWFAPHDVQGGKKLYDQIDQAIRIYDRLLLILSEDSMASNWVKTEIANARQKEANEGKRVLFPIRLVDFEAIKGWKLFHADTGIDSAREIREYFIPDFSNWKDHGSYKKAFERLLRDLKADTTSVPPLELKQAGQPNC